MLRKPKQLPQRSAAYERQTRMVTGNVARIQELKKKFHILSVKLERRNPALADVNEYARLRKEMARLTKVTGLQLSHDVFDAQRKLAKGLRKGSYASVEDIMKTKGIMGLTAAHFRLVKNRRKKDPGANLAYSAILDGSNDRRMKKGAYSLVLDWFDGKNRLTAEQLYRSIHSK